MVAPVRILQAQGVAEQGVLGVRASAVARPGPVFGALGVAVLATVVLHVLGAGQLDPRTTTISDYVSIPGGAVLLAIAVSGLAVAAGFVALRIARWGWVLGIGCAGLLATVLVPTNVVGSPVTTDAVLHRYAAGLFFVSLPIAALLSRLAPWLTVVSVLAGIAFLVSHIPLLFPQWPAAHAIAVVLPRGLAERGLLTVDIALLARLAWCTE
jgi:hypothetical protein